MKCKKENKKRCLRICAFALMLALTINVVIFGSYADTIPENSATSGENTENIVESDQMNTLEIDKNNCNESEKEKNGEISDANKNSVTNHDNKQRIFTKKSADKKEIKTSDSDLLQWEYTEESNEIVLTKYKGNERDVIVPGIIQNKQVVLQGAVFKPTTNSYNIETITIGSQGANVKSAESLSGMFSGCHATTIDIRGLDTSGATDMSKMFENCSKLKSIKLDGIDTSNVTNMSSMFASTPLSEIDVSHFNLSKCRNINGMFANCPQLEKVNTLGWDTSNIENFGGVFSWDKKLTSLDVSHWDTSSAVDMSGMFAQCESLQYIDVSNFKTSNAANMKMMFGGCKNLVNIDVSGFDTSNVVNMDGMFSENMKLSQIDVSGFDTSNVTNMYRMFYRCSSLPKIDVSGFKTSKVTDMSFMFYDCRGITDLLLYNFDTSNVKDFKYMFYNCAYVPVLDLSGFSVSADADTSYMLHCAVSPFKPLAIITKDPILTSNLNKYVDYHDANKNQVVGRIPYHAKIICEAESGKFDDGSSIKEFSRGNHFVYETMDAFRKDMRPTQKELIEQLEKPSSSNQSFEYWNIIKDGSTEKLESNTKTVDFGLFSNNEMHLKAIYGSEKEDSKPSDGNEQSGNDNKHGEVVQTKRAKEALSSQRVNTPQTGDSTNIWELLIVFTTAGITALVLLRKNKRSNVNENKEN